MKPQPKSNNAKQLSCPHRYKTIVVLGGSVTCEKLAHKCLECGKLFNIRTECS
jgi:hypothetical protein